MRILICALGALTLCACSDEPVADGEAGAETTAAKESDSAEDTAAAEEPEPTMLDAIPAKYHGTWDVRQNNPTFCTDLSDGIMRVEAKEILFYEAAFTARSIEQVSVNKLRADGAFQDLGENSEETYDLELSDSGKRLVLAAEDFDPFEYEKCAKVREAHLIPAEFQGTWSSQGTCKVADRDKLLVIEPTRKFWFGKTSNFTKVEMVGDGSVELEDDGQEEPYGIVLQDGGKSGSLVGPDHSPIPLMKCKG